MRGDVPVDRQINRHHPGQLRLSGAGRLRAAAAHGALTGVAQTETGMGQGRQHLPGHRHLNGCRLRRRQRLNGGGGRGCHHCHQAGGQHCMDAGQHPLPHAAAKALPSAGFRLLLCHCVLLAE
ncbi:hypothetical protein [Leisingera sp. NJS201]|uniref:hypothetical protein n=1 Tax=Leisingera sp. NJS201 TaxID=2508306 RepID=UPI0020C7B20D|nr:hypothetical protein [Leisingera sp. NJS201]